jgi:hypothetical protein
MADHRLLLPRTSEEDLGIDEGLDSVFSRGNKAKEKDGDTL